MTTASTTGADQLPAVVRRYLDAHDGGDGAGALSAFTEQAVVVDEQRTHRGSEEIRAWLEETSAAFSYTAELVAVERTDDRHWTVVQHLTGDFPGGEVDLRYRFTLEADRIAALPIAP
ncbi:nuclear transport factor 2 family protein [Desertihabitans brevis]|uniref:Nuclear transport factor 2 family protein n=1 Tax=Desertihabitans brevis TaxID=2268447 RepID=A0A367YPV4_9ACTN|nr:nuclear transport factor 2 family protein [Desertihabitans brevis]RCK67915.1 nuclear transport factor 2 family protein [Desertihabitans brevis]